MAPPRNTRTYPGRPASQPMRNGMLPPAAAPRPGAVATQIPVRPSTQIGNQMPGRIGSGAPQVDPYAGTPFAGWTPDGAAGLGHALDGYRVFDASNAPNLAYLNSQNRNLQQQLGQTGDLYGNQRQAMLSKGLAQAAGYGIDDEIGRIQSGSARGDLGDIAGQREIIKAQFGANMSDQDRLDGFITRNRALDVEGFDTARGAANDQSEEAKYKTMLDQASSGGGGGAGWNAQNQFTQNALNTQNRQIGTQDRQSIANTEKSLGDTQKRRSDLFNDLLSSGLTLDQQARKADERLQTLDAEARRRGVSRAEAKAQLEAEMAQLGLNQTNNVGQILDQMGQNTMKVSSIATARNKFGMGG